jgi:5-methylcytosine-specific restriction protein A
MHNTTYLLTWNPNSWEWDDIEAEAERTAEGKSVQDRWSCGNTKRILPGDRLFLLRQGREPRGIVASGWATSVSYEGPHWDGERRDKGDTALHVDVRFERILNPALDDPLPMSALKVGPLASVNWATPASGIRIKEGIEDLERLWAAHTWAYEAMEGKEPSALEGTITLAMRRHRSRERWLRDAKLEDAKRANSGRLRCEVPGCGFDFFETYGEIGRDFAHVHHLRPLGELTRPSETSLTDLAVVCANCHAMIHRGNVTRPLDHLMIMKKVKMPANSTWPS